MIRKFIKRPIVVEAFQFGIDPVPDWFFKEVIEISPDARSACIRTLEGDMWFKHGDYVIKGIHNECYPCAKSVFEDSYEEVALVDD